MADISNLTNFLTDVANAIRTKKETEAEIPAEQFDSEILAINTVNNQNKTITENGTYNADEGYTGLGEVVVNVESTGKVPVKLFNTIDEMNSDENPEDGDLALCYGSTYDYVHDRTIVNTVTFPKQVVLSQAVTETITGLFTYNESPTASKPELWQYYIKLTPTSYKSSRTPYSTEQIMVEYTSADGVTYNRVTELENDEYTFDLVDEWYARWDNSILDNFCLGISTPQFNGVFKYGTAPNSQLFDGYKNPRIVNKVFEYDSKEGFPVDVLQKINDILKTDSTLTTSNYDRYLVVKKSDTIYNCYCVLQTGSSDPWWALPAIYNNGTSRYICASYSNSDITKFLKLVVNLETNTFTKEEKGYTTYNYMRVCETFDVNDLITAVQMDRTNVEPDTSAYLQVFGTNSGTTTSNTNYKNTYIKYLEQTKYFPAKNQLNLSKPSELLPDIIGYGYGVVTGDGSIYDKLSFTTLCELVNDTLDYNSIAYLHDARYNQLFMRADINSHTDMNRYASITPYNGNIDKYGIILNKYAFDYLTLNEKYDITVKDNILNVYVFDSDSVKNITLPETMRRYTLFEYNNYLYVFGVNTENKTIICKINLDTNEYTSCVDTDALTYTSYGVHITAIYDNKLYFCTAITTSTTNIRFDMKTMDLDTLEINTIYTENITCTNSSDMTICGGFITTKNHIFVNGYYTNSSSKNYTLLINYDGTKIKSATTSSAHLIKWYGFSKYFNYVGYETDSTIQMGKDVVNLSTLNVTTSSASTSINYNREFTNTYYSRRVTDVVKIYDANLNELTSVVYPSDNMYIFEDFWSNTSIYVYNNNGKPEARGLQFGKFTPVEVTIEDTFTPTNYSLQTALFSDKAKSNQYVIRQHMPIQLDASPMTQEEYDQALTTANEIKGGNE